MKNMTKVCLFSSFEALPLLKTTAGLSILILVPERRPWKASMYPRMLLGLAGDQRNFITEDGQEFSDSLKKTNFL